MRFGIAIPGCIALCQPIFIIFANNWFGLNIRHRHSTFSIFEIWNLNIQITGCKFAHPVLPPTPVPVPLSVALAPMRPTYFAYELTPRNPFPAALSGPIQFSISLHLSPMFGTFRFGIWFRVDLGLTRLYSAHGWLFQRCEALSSDAGDKVQLRCLFYGRFRKWFSSQTRMQMH